MKDKLIPLSKDRLFYTLQMEGIHVGRPSIFIRLAYCNLACTFCDSAYTWKPDYVNDKEKPDFVDREYLINEIKKYNCKNLVFTGGEPLLFQDNINSLFDNYKLWGYKVDIETNGTILPKNTDLYEFFYNVSPKLSNNGADSFEKRINSEAIEFFRDYGKSIFKFVIKEKEDWNEIKKDFIDKFNIPFKKIWLMPEGQTREQ